MKSCQAMSLYAHAYLFIYVDNITHACHVHMYITYIRNYNLLLRRICIINVRFDEENYRDSGFIFLIFKIVVFKLPLQKHKLKSHVCTMLPGILYIVDHQVFLERHSTTIYNPYRKTLILFACPWQTLYTYP